MVVIGDPVAISSWLRQASGGKAISSSDMRYFMNMATATQFAQLIEDHPGCLRVAIASAGDVLYVPAGHIVAVQVRNAEDILGLRFGATSLADLPAFKELASSALIKWVLQHLSSLDGGATPPAPAGGNPGAPAPSTPQQHAPAAALALLDGAVADEAPQAAAAAVHVAEAAPEGVAPAAGQDQPAEQAPAAVDDAAAAAAAAVPQVIEV